MNQTRRGLSAGALVIAGLALSACLPRGLRLPQSDLLPLLERKSGLIAYVGSDGNIYTVDQTGQNPTTITDDAATGQQRYRVYGQPTWSQDGETLAFPSYEGDPDQAPDKNSLFVARKDGSELTETYTSPSFIIYHSWSPDGRRIGLLSETPNQQTLALKLIGAGKDNAGTETLDTGAPLYWTWAPDGRSLLVHAGAANARLAFLQLEDGVVEQGLSEYESSLFRAPAFAPDGRHFLIAGQVAQGTSALLLADREGAETKRLTEYNSSDTISFAWSPDGQRVAYLTSAQYSGPITVVDPSGRRDDVTLAEDAYAFFWSPDSQSLAYFTTEAITPTQTTDGEAGEAVEPQLAWKMKLLDANTGRTYELAQYQPTDRFLQMIPYFDQYHQSATIWSPDSQNLVISTYLSDGTPGIFVVAASGNREPRFIAEGFVGIWSWK
jgi:TolB protein